MPRISLYVDDPERRQANSRAWRRLNKKKQKHLAQEKRYDRYLRSRAWQKKRAKVLKRANGICEICGDDPPTQIHHLTYQNLGHEQLDELRALCNHCHIMLHEEKIYRNSVGRTTSGALETCAHQGGLGHKHSADRKVEARPTGATRRSQVATNSERADTTLGLDGDGAAPAGD
jgi:hypothetical protein